MMHRLTKTRLTINTSKACLSNNKHASSSTTTSTTASTFSQPYTPTPPSCRLHKIYEEKLDILGSLGHENWFDDNANPFYRHREPDVTRRAFGRSHGKHGHSHTHSHGHGHHHGIKSTTTAAAAAAITPTVTLTKPTVVATAALAVPKKKKDILAGMFQEPKNSFEPIHEHEQEQSNRNHPRSEDQEKKPNKNSVKFSTEFTGFESLHKHDLQRREPTIDFFGDGGVTTAIDDLNDEKEHDNETIETLGLSFGAGFRSDGEDSECSTSSGEETDPGQREAMEARKQLPHPRTEIENRRLSNRNRIMDRGHLLPDICFSIPIAREPRFVLGANNNNVAVPKVRALSPYPRSRTFVPQD